MGKEAAIMATISLVLTVVNIICIFITATVVLKVTANFSSYFSIFPLSLSRWRVTAIFTKEIVETTTYNEKNWHYFLTG
jgi:hypothetical protein